MKHYGWKFAVTLMAVGLPVWSQQQYPLRSVTRTVVKADRVADYEDLLKQNVAMAKKAGADRGIFVWRVAAGNTSEYWSVSQLAKYADRDQAPAWVKNIPPGEAAARFARLRNCVVSTTSTIERYRDDLSVVSGTATTPSRYLRLIRTRVRQGKAEEYANLIKSDLLPAYKKAGGQVRVRQVAWGGNRSDFTSTSGFEKWAELDETPAVVKAMGEDAYRKYQEKRAALVTGTDWQILRFLPDLSYIPEAR